MSTKYGRPAFPTRGYIFSDNAGMSFIWHEHRIARLDLGFALFVLVLLTVFIYAWEKILARALGRLLDTISAAGSENASCMRIRPIIVKVAW